VAGSYENAALNGPQSDRLVGTLVHRLLQRHGLEAADVTEDAASRLLRPDESGAGVAAAAVAAYQAICARSDVRTLYTSGEPLHEVPFTMKVDGAWLRGSIDCLVHIGADRVALMEFKTGRPRDEHRLQIELYREAARRLFPAATVDAHLIYAAEGTPDGLGGAAKGAWR
jgi:ATP-dependent exoDNAse (exonuclease V) beta subunit